MFAKLKTFSQYLNRFLNFGFHQIKKPTDDLPIGFFLIFQIKVYKPLRNEEN